MTTDQTASLPEITVDRALAPDFPRLRHQFALADIDAHHLDSDPEGDDRGLFVARANGDTVGLMRLGPTFFSRPFVELLLVHPDHRRRGVGTALLRHARQLHAGAKLFTSTNLSNQPAQALFARCGFRLCGYVDELDPGDPELIFVWSG